jgi:hypothetical protein
VEGRRGVLDQAPPDRHEPVRGPSNQQIEPDDELGRVIARELDAEAARLALQLAQRCLLDGVAVGWDF